jgi:hypothetical protein
MTRFPSRSDVRVQATVLCACLAFVYFFNLSTPGNLDRAGQIKGTDFIHFYVLGSVALHGPEPALYDAAALARRAAVLVPESTRVYYLPIYGPQVALLFAPFAALPYLSALCAWLLITGTVYAVCCACVWHTCTSLRAERRLVFVVAAANPAFFNLMAHGQNSAIALASITTAFFALRHRWSFFAGLAIGMLVYKPQLGIVLGSVFVLSREWRVIAGALVGAAAQLGVARLWFGPDVMREYWNALAGIGAIQPLLDVKPYQMHSLFSFWNALFPSTSIAAVLYLLCAAVVLIASWRVWIARESLSLRYAFLLLATALVSPHLNVYDLVILAPALLLVADWAVGHPSHPAAKRVQQLLYFSYALPLAGIAARFTHVQLSVVAMSGLAWVLASVVLERGIPDDSGDSSSGARVNSRSAVQTG